MNYGPNGGLVFCVDYLIQNLDWLKEKIGDYGDDYLLLDMPGQVELYTHYNHVNQIAKVLQGLGYNVASIYLIDSRFLTDSSVFLSATLMATAVMINLELTHFNLLSKMDIVQRDKMVSTESELESFLHADAQFLLNKLDQSTSTKFRKLNQAMAELITDYSLVRFYPFSSLEPDMIADFLLLVDTATQYGEGMEPKDTLTRREDADEE